jgi:thiol:disulfide interchange protein DsbD
MQPRSGTQVNNGSLVSACTFGIINGLVASPCLSPGLALILGIVSEMANPVLGFLLLFVFGIGSSMPLLIIGTFSSSLHILPRAGIWMIEFKKVFGFLLLGMCIYYIKAFIAAWIYKFALAAYLFGVSGYYIYYGFVYRLWFVQCLGFIIGFIGCFHLVEGYFIRAPLDARIANNDLTLSWETDYQEARDKALSENKLLLLDFTAQWCTLCKQLENTFFRLPAITAELAQVVIPTKIDCTDTQDTQCKKLCAKYSVMGYPTILLIEPQSESIVMQWGSDLGQLSAQDFLKRIYVFLGKE